MNYVEKNIDAFGGVCPMGDRVDHPASTVMSWKAHCSIPNPYKHKALAAAQANELGPTKLDFFSDFSVSRGIRSKTERSDQPQAEGDGDMMARIVSCLLSVMTLGDGTENETSRFSPYVCLRKGVVYN